MNHNPSTNPEERIKNVIAENLVNFRKQAELTQQQLADKLNYSDKAISKWERAEGIPDVLVLKALADLYGVTVNDFLTEHKEHFPIKHSRKNIIARHWLVTLLSFVLVWLVATIVTVVWLLVDKSVPVAKYAYLVAGPVSLIVVLVFSCIWGKLWMRCATVSLLVWSACALVDVALTVTNSFLVYFVGGVLQLLVILWFLLRFFVLKERKKRKLAEEQKE